MDGFKMFQIFFNVSTICLLLLLLNDKLEVFGLEERVAGEHAPHGSADQPKPNPRFQLESDRVWPIGSKLAQNQFDRETAQDLINGGYILVVRHAHRNKWLDTTMYDAMEALSQPAENSYFAGGVCLSGFGNVQAKAMGEWIRSIGVPIGEVISSVSCRARQTASLAFKAPDILYSRLLNYYGTPYPVFDEPVDMHFAEIKKILLKHAPRDKTNTVISAHNNTISIEMLDGVLESGHRRQADIDVLLEEGGFHVLKVVGKKLLWVTKFHTFQGFANKFTARPTEVFPFANPSSEAKKSS